MNNKINERKADRMMNLDNFSKGPRRGLHTNTAKSESMNPLMGQEKDQYYKFYLDSAQKAIEMMRQEHKSASLMRLN